MQNRKIFKRKQNKVFSFINLKGHPDSEMLVMIIAFTVFGALMVYDSSFIAHSNPFHFFIFQLLWILIGSAMGFVAYIVDYHFLKKLILPGLVVTIFLLIIVLVPGIGTEINGARRWIDIKVSLLQPSELTKLVFIIYLASWASKQGPRKKINKEAIIEHIKHELIPFVTILAVVCSLVLLEPDLATTGVVGLTALSVYFLSGRDAIHNFGTMLILFFMGLSGLLAGLLAPYRFARIKTYMDFLQTGQVQDPRDDGYQLQNILIAVGSGGLFGVGFGESRQKFHYLGDTSFSDNIFAVFAEEFGLLGCVILASAYFYFLMRGLNLAGRIEDRFGRLLVSGITIWIILQAYLHMAANIGLIPVTGITLPFISYGGSSMVTFLVASGILLNVSRSAKKI